MIFSFSKKFVYLRMRRFQMARKQQNWLPERAGMCLEIISSMQFDNKSIWNNPKISVPKMCKIVVSKSLEGWWLKNYEKKISKLTIVNEAHPELKKIKYIPIRNTLVTLFAIIRQKTWYNHIACSLMYWNWRSWLLIDVLLILF